MRALASRSVHLFALAALAGACQPVDRVVEPIEAGPVQPSAGRDAAAPAIDASAPNDASPPIDASPPTDAEVPPDASLCAELPPLAGLRVGPLPQALADAVAPGFARAVCSCRGYVGGLDANLITDAWDGSLGPYAPRRSVAGGDVALNAELNIEAGAVIGGTLIAAGGGGVTLGAEVDLAVGGDLGVGGSLLGALAGVRVGGNAAVLQRIDLAQLRVGGTLTQPAGETLAVAGTQELGALVNEPVAIPPPCGCGQGELIDVAAIVQAELPASIPVGELDCAAPAAGGAVALYVPGGLRITEDLVLATGPGADLVLVVEGDLLVEGRLELGSAARQRRVHLFVGGGGTIQLSSGGSISGVLYAPNADLVLEGPLDVYGALFVERVSARRTLTVHQER